MMQFEKKSKQKINWPFLIAFFLNVLISFYSFAGATWSTRTVDTPARTGGCAGTYTISLNTPNSILNRVPLGNAVVVTFNAAAGVDATTCSGGTFNGTAIGAMTLTATTVSFAAPVQANHNTAFTIVLNNITHGSGVTVGTISVDAVALSGNNTGTTTNSYTTAAFAGTTAVAGPDQNICISTATFAGNTVAGGETGVWSKISGSGTITTPSSPTSGVTSLGSLANTFRWTITITATGCKSSDDIIITNNNDLSSVLAYASSNCPASTTEASLTLSSSPGTIQWQQNINGGGWNNIPGGTTTPYNVSGIDATYTFRANVTTACGTYPISATPAVTSYSMYDYTGGDVNYSTADAANHCYNNLIAGQKYCFAFVNSHDIEVDWQPNGCSICPSIYMKLKGLSTSLSSNSGTGDCANSSSIASNCAQGRFPSCSECGISMYDNSCGVVLADGFQFGSGCASPAMVVGNVYYICFTVPAACGGMSMCPMINCTAGNCAASPLPIELLYFNAVLSGDKTQLYWATATETNNDYFTVERTVDGKNFTSVGILNGAGNSTSILNYNMIDDAPLIGISYYRLKQTDYDGKYAYSRLVSINSESSNNNLKLSYFYSDRDNAALKYEVDIIDNKNCFIQIVDVLGRVLINDKIETSSPSIQTVDISNLSNGMYFFRITDGIEVISKKFLR